MPTNKCRRRRRGCILAAPQQEEVIPHQAAPVGGPARGRGRGGVHGGRGGRGRGDVHGGRGRGDLASVQAAEQAPEPVPAAGNDQAAAVGGPARGRRRRFVYGGPRLAGGGVYVCRGRGGQPSEQAAEVPASEKQDDLNPDDYEPEPEPEPSEENSSDEEIEYEPQNPTAQFSDAVRMFDVIRKAKELLAARLEAMELPVQESLDDVDVIYVDWRLRRADLDRYYEESENWFKEHFQFCIPVFMDDGSVEFVRLTPKMEATAAQRTHHIVALVRKSDDAHCEILIENFSLYAVAMRVVYADEDRREVKWALVGDEDLNTKLYKFERTEYKPSYNDAESVFLGKTTGWNIFNFVESLRETKREVPADGQNESDDEGDEEEYYVEADQDELGVDGEGDHECAEQGNVQEAAGEEGDDDGVAAQEAEAVNSSSKGKKDIPVDGGKRKGKKWLDTIYVVLCEGRRFLSVRKWATGMRGGFPFADLVHYWSSLGKGVQLLFLYLMEEMLALQECENGLLSELCELSKVEALSWWRDRQVDLAGKLEFYEETWEDSQLVAPLLRQLACTELTMIKTEHEIWDKICLRILQYNGPWEDDIMELSESGVASSSKKRPVPPESMLLLADPSVFHIGLEAEVRDWWNFFEKWSWQEDEVKFWSTDAMFLRCLMDWFVMF